jgi:ABC-type glycerol-3-phosphate transport system substrate-binding protein
MGHGIGNLPVEVSNLDVVWPEIERVTGVSINFDDSYSNGDNTFDIKMAMLAGTKDWPDICTNPQLVTPFVDGDAIYDLTDLVDTYYPSILAYREDPNFKTVFKNPAVTGGNEGKVFGLPFSIGADYSILKPYLGIEEDDPKYMAAFAPPPNYHQACVKVRDDILKMIFPEAKTQDEIEALYLEQGFFTREDVFDVPINTLDDFIKFLRDINDLGLMEGSLPVYPTYAMCGLDNYPLGARLASMLLGWGTGGDCFTHWNNEKKEIVLTTTTDEFRNLYKIFNQLIREGVIPQESLIDDDAAFLAKMNNGQYAVTYAEWRWADDDVLKQAGKPYRYRYVYFDIPVQADKYVQPLSAPGFNLLLIFKDKVAEEDLPQILMMMDYANSALYHKMKYWGPKDAGLFEEVDGVRQFVDPELAAEMVSNTFPELRMKYALQNGFYNAGYLVRRPEFGIWFRTGHVPYMFYEQERKAEDAEIFFKSGLVESYPDILTELPWI